MCERATVLGSWFLALATREGATRVSTRSSESLSHYNTSKGMRGEGETQRRHILLLIGLRLPTYIAQGWVGDGRGCGSRFVFCFLLATCVLRSTLSLDLDCGG